MDDRDGWVVVEIEPAQTHAVRLAVLRADTPTRTVTFDGDTDPDTVHLGVFVAGRLVATSTWMTRELPSRPGVPAVQLRGMATATDHQGRGVGAALVAAGLAAARAAGVSVVWANARDGALAFYRREGFVVEGEGFIDAGTGLPHHVVTRSV